MKTTLDLPADLVREMKLRAVREGRKLRDVATEVFRRGMVQSDTQASGIQNRVKIPLIECRVSADALTPEEVADALLKQEAEWTHEVAGR